MTELWSNGLQTLTALFGGTTTWKFLFQFGILVGLIYVLYSRFIRYSQAADRLLKGLFVVFLGFTALWGTARFFELGLLEVVAGAILQMLVIGLIVIFQPELRKMLLYLGQADLFALGPVLTKAPEAQKTEHLIQELGEAVRYLSKSKTGALLVLESRDNPGDGTSYLEAGTPLDAQVSSELLLTIFHTNTPLHDGAAIIGPDNRLVAAGVLLPLTENPTLSWRYGTRHRAAIGLSELSDSYCIVVSEETGSISLVNKGALSKLSSAEELVARLEQVFHVQAKARADRSRRFLFSQRFKTFWVGSQNQTGTLQNRLQSMFNRRGSEAAVSSQPASAVTSTPHEASASSQLASNSPAPSSSAAFSREASLTDVLREALKKPGGNANP